MADFIDLNAIRTTANQPQPVDPTLLVLSTLDLLVQTIVMDRFMDPSTGKVDMEAADRVIQEIRSEAVDLARANTQKIQSR